MTTDNNGWNDLLGTDWDDLPFAHERDDGLGWYYRDEPYGGFLIVAETTAFFHDDETGEEIAVRLGIGVEFIDWGAAVPGGDGYLADAKAVVHPDSLTESSRADVAPHGDTDPNYYDVASYGYSVPVEDVHADDWKTAYEEAKSALAFADFGVGFILDRPMNRMGMTGWDMVRDAANDIDGHDAAMERLKARE